MEIQLHQLDHNIENYIERGWNIQIHATELKISSSQQAFGPPSRWKEAHYVHALFCTIATWKKTHKARAPVKRIMII